MRVYLITFRTYGSWLRGHDAGWNRRGAGYGRESPVRGLLRKDHERLKHVAVRLSDEMRAALREALPAISEQRGWSVLAIYVGQTHIHIVVEAHRPPEQVLHYLKSKATRVLRCANLVARTVTLWSRHGSTRYLNSPAELNAAVDYVHKHDDDEATGDDGRDRSSTAS